MRTLKILSRFSHECDKVLIVFVLSVYGLAHPSALVCSGILALFLFRYDKVLFYGFVILFVVHSTVRMQTFQKPPYEARTGIVESIDIKEFSTQAQIGCDDGTYLVHGFDEAPEVGDTVVFTGKAKAIDPPLFEDGFDYEKYLKSQGVRGILELEKWDRIEGRYTLPAFRKSVSDRFDEQQPDTAFLMRTFILADSSALDEAFKEKASAMGVSHLFAVSGMHVAFMAGILFFGLKRLMPRWAAETLVVLFLVFYIFLTGAPPSVLRASSMAVLLIMVKRLKIPLSAVDILSLICAAVLVLRPYSLYDLGFTLSFMVSFTLLMGSDLLRGRRKIAQAFTVSIMAFLVTVPIVFSIQHQMNLMSVVYNVFLVWVLMVIVLPLVYLTMVVPLISPFLLAVYTYFEQCIVVLHDHGSIFVKGYIPPGILRVLYWVLFAWMMAGHGKRLRIALRLMILVGFTGVMMSVRLMDPASRLTMFPVMGDAFLIEDAHTRCNILIDTGDESTARNLADALGRKQIRRLDHVIITHMHADHFGGYEAVASKVRIENTISPKNVGAFEDRTLTCGDIRFYIYPFEAHYQNENDNSIIVWLDTGHETILFTGDMEKSREGPFLETYAPLPPIDILKAGHHGSDTSSTRALIEAVNPKEVLVSAHPDNHFGHPGKSAIERFLDHGTIIHRTDVSGSVELYNIFSRRYKKTALKD
ncbi:MAG: DNA internalization-related competence protein ComEC/Rec2 [Bacillota bacterium]